MKMLRLEKKKTDATPKVQNSLIYLDLAFGIERKSLGYKIPINVNTKVN